MKVKLAKTAGFCMGVRRAMAMVLAEANKADGPLFTFGPLIHNTQVLVLLASKGVTAVDDINDLTTGRVVIRAHGIPPQQRRAIKNTGLKVLDATCPRVARVQAIVRYHTGKGYSAVIVGDRDHAEVVGLMGYSKTPAHVIRNVEDVAALPDMDRMFVVAQTTQNGQTYADVCEALKKRFRDVLVFDTICEATSHRQQEVKSFAGMVDALVVVGGYHSGNTRRLAEVSKQAGLPAYQVETEKDLDKEKLAAFKTIGVTAGASTPSWMIKNVLGKIEGIRGRRETAFARWLKRAFKFTILSNIVVAAGAFCFAYAASVLSQRTPDLIYPCLTFLYIHAMYVFNQFLDKGAGVYNDPEKSAFLKKNKKLLIITGISAISIALVFSFYIGITTFLAFTGLSLLGIIYSVPIVPEKIQYKYPYSKIKDIPGSRSLSESLAWAAVISLLPLLELEKIVWPAVLITSTIVFSMACARSILFSIFRVQGDLIVGRETLPITIGEKKTLVLLRIILVLSALVLACAPMVYPGSAFSYFILLPVGTFSLCLLAFEKRWLFPGITFEALLEGNFILAGLVALIWQAL
ncbi:MAG: 4-hydroxy-3-methylbut-2-enyl diphosphate reductase [Desulfobacterales bacterium]|nr:4-hydroxy-3-methylbut-2-enyl diphosphate reductase [Desulfobacterales bacterium]